MKAPPKTPLWPLIAVTLLAAPALAWEDSYTNVQVVDTSTYGVKRTVTSKSMAGIFATPAAFVAACQAVAPKGACAEQGAGLISAEGLKTRFQGTQGQLYSAYSYECTEEKLIQVYPYYSYKECVAATGVDVIGLICPNSKTRYNVPGSPAGVTTIACYPRVVKNRAQPKPKRCEGVGNPIVPATGAKLQRLSTGFELEGLSLELSYDSTSQLPGQAELVALPDGVEGRRPFGKLWSSSFHRFLEVTNSRQLHSVNANRGDGSSVSFVGNVFPATTWQAMSRVTGSNLVLLYRGDTTAAVTQWRLIDTDAGAIETYDFEGKLLSRARIGGGQITFTYSDATHPLAAGLLLSARDTSGRTISFTYVDAGARAYRVSRIVGPGPANEVFTYSPALNLAGVTWPDGRLRQLKYENPAFPWALTSMIDERGVTVGTYAYDAAGRAMSTNTAGFNAFSVSRATAPVMTTTATLVPYDPYDSYSPPTYVRFNTEWSSPPTGVTVTDPMGAQSSVGVSLVQGDLKVTSRSQPAGAGCDASTSSTLYDAAGNPTQKDDFNGRRRCFAYTNGLETTRVEGLSQTASCATMLAAGALVPSDARKISTQWHPDWQVATKVAEPGRIVTNVYNGQLDPFTGTTASCAPGTALLPDGKPLVVLCRSVQQPTTDLTGALAFAAPNEPGVAAREERWSYDAQGRQLMYDGPRVDVSDVTVSTYYSDTTVDHSVGDLASVTSPTGQLTRFTRYNAAGKVLSTVNADGSTSAAAYDARQRPTSLVTPQESTQYTYDAAGRVVTEGSRSVGTTSFTYDNANQLLTVTDPQGQRIEYTRDAAGRIKTSQVKSSTGVLLRSSSQDFDALGRVQRQTGAAQ